MPLLLVATGGAAVYYFLQYKDATDAKATTDDASGGGQPPSSGGTHITASSGRPTPEVPARNLVPLVLSGRWGWPVPRWQGRAPVISDHFRSPRPDHNGVDLMFARLASDPFPAGGGNATGAFVMPDNWPGVAAADGVLWSSGRTPRGYAVVIDHGSVVTFYTHFESLLVPEIKPSSSRLHPDNRIQITAGQPLGVIGKDPQDREGIKHLHFELWRGGPSDAIDPAPLMKAWEVFSPQEASASLRNARRHRQREPDLVHVTDYYRTKPGHGARP